MPSGSPTAARGRRAHRVALADRTLRPRLGSAVRDTGIGIPRRSVQARLFDDYRQSRTTPPRASSGTGLGSASVSQLATLMGGELGAEQQALAGSRFWLRIRLAAGYARMRQVRWPMQRAAMLDSVGPSPGGTAPAAGPETTS